MTFKDYSKAIDNVKAAFGFDEKKAMEIVDVVTDTLGLKPEETEEELMDMLFAMLVGESDV